jgi:hypothetical protein
MVGKLGRTVGALLLIIGLVQAAGVPGVINYQGRLNNASGQPVPDGTYQIKFKIYGSAAGADGLWESGFQPVPTVGGAFNYLLGSSAALPIGLFSSDTVRYLGITVGTDPEMSPRARLCSAPYAFQSLRADSSTTAFAVTDGAITNAGVNSSANIAPSKIAGTAATLSGSQTFTGGNQFASGIQVYDSVFRTNSYGVRVGTAVAPIPEHLFEVNRHFNTTSARQGVTVSLFNASSGTLYGLYSDVEHSDAGGGGTAYGVYGTASSDGSSRSGVYGEGRALTLSSTSGVSFGIRGSAFYGATAYGVYGYANAATTNYAGYFSGNVHVTGTLSKGGGSFKIDHPLDPENKYLQHSFVESPDMMNIYNGIVSLDGFGRAVVALPTYFMALNRDCRYQLTAIGAPGPNLYIESEIQDNSFSIAGGAPGMKVSWQVTGIRNDAWASANRIQVEVDKKPEERGKYLHPAAFSQPEERGVDYANTKRPEPDLSDGQVER